MCEAFAGVKCHSCFRSCTAGSQTHALSHRDTDTHTNRHTHRHALVWCWHVHISCLRLTSFLLLFFFCAPVSSSRGKRVYIYMALSLYVYLLFSCAFTALLCWRFSLSFVFTSIVLKSVFLPPPSHPLFTLFSAPLSRSWLLLPSLTCLFLVHALPHKPSSCLALLRSSH